VCDTSLVWSFLVNILDQRLILILTEMDSGKKESVSINISSVRVNIQSTWSQWRFNDKNNKIYYNYGGTCILIFNLKSTLHCVANAVLIVIIRSDVLEKLRFQMDSYSILNPNYFATVYARGSN
jgi:hypothetical protein